MLNSTVQIRPRTAELFRGACDSGLLFLNPHVQDLSLGQGPARGTERDKVQIMSLMLSTVCGAGSCTKTRGVQAEVSLLDGSARLKA
jgi:hypothetical protein